MYRFKAFVISISVLLSSLFMASCSQESSSQNMTMPGSDRDAHGCIASAGYSWCQRTEQCERPWELAELKDFENTQQAFEAFCGQSATKYQQ